MFKKYLTSIEKKLLHHYWFLQPDLHERQRFISSFIDEGDTVLDVGGEQRILDKVAKIKQYYTLNVSTQSNQTPSYMHKTSKDLYYDGEHIPFDDNHFDTVVCIDVLEHVPAKKRQALIKEMLRVARKQLLISAPLGTESHIEGEKRFYAYLTSKGYEVDFLREHISYGLPNPKEIKKWKDVFSGDLYYAGDWRITNRLFSIQIFETSSGIINHALLFLKLVSYFKYNVFFYPFMTGKKTYSSYTNRFYMHVKKVTER